MRTIELKLPDDQAARLDRFASSVQKNARDATAQLIEEGLRHAEFPVVEFRDTEHGREPYVTGSSLAVWEVVLIAESYGGSAAQAASHLRWPISRLERVLAYARSYSREIALALAENRNVDRADLECLLPTARWT